MTRQRIIFTLFAVLLTGAACVPNYTAPTLEPAVETRLQEMDSNGERPLGRYGVFVMSPDGEEVQQIYASNRLRHSLRVSPTGEWVVFVEYTADENDDGVANEGDIDSAEIGIMRPDGSEAQILTNDEAVDVSPTWAPDGEHILFASSRNNEDYILDMFVMDLDGGNITNITNTPEVAESDPDWAGDTIAFVRRHKDAEAEEPQAIWLMMCNLDALDECDGSEDSIKQLTSPDISLESEFNYVFGDFDPKISPDGETIVFYRHQNEDWSIGSLPVGDWDIYTIPVEGGSETLVSQGVEADLMPMWSPDGTQLAFWVLSEDFNDLGDIYTIDADGGNRQKVEGEVDVRYEQIPAWMSAEVVEEYFGVAEPWIIFTGEWVDGGAEESD
jgi:Tol biopolymer transport system component